MGWQGPGQALQGPFCSVDLSPSWADDPAATGPGARLCVPGVASAADKTRSYSYRTRYYNEAPLPYSPIQGEKKSIL